jgi:hypothetical protein
LSGADKKSGDGPRLSQTGKRSVPEASATGGQLDSDGDNDLYLQEQ